MTKLFKKADPEKKQYGTPTPINPLDQKDKDADELKIKKPQLPGQPGNAPGNQASNGPLVETQHAPQASVEKEAERTILPPQPKPVGKSPYEYDSHMSRRTMPIAQPPTRAQGAPAWVTGSRRATLLDKKADKLPNWFVSYGWNPKKRKPENPEVRRERASRKQVNDKLAILSRKYHPVLPIQEIRDLLENHGFNPAAMDGVYTGREGSMREQCGPRTWISMSWHKMPTSGLWEITAYLS